MDPFTLSAIVGGTSSFMGNLLTAAGNSKQRKWAAAEAQKQRDWQERLLSSAHQIEVKDLRAAGLNPILSANNGAHVPSGGTVGVNAHDEGAAFARADLGNLFLNSAKIKSDIRNNKRLTDAEVKLKEKEAKNAESQTALNAARTVKESNQLQHEVIQAQRQRDFEREMKTYDRELIRTQQRLEHDFKRRLQDSEHLNTQTLQWKDYVNRRQMQRTELGAQFERLDKDHSFQKTLQQRNISNQRYMQAKSFVHEVYMQDSQFRHAFEKLSQQRQHEYTLLMLNGLFNILSGLTSIKSGGKMK